MIYYAMIGANDVEKLAKFYEAVLATIGYSICHKGSSYGFALGGEMKSQGTIWIGKPFDGSLATPSNGSMIGLSAPNKQAVRDFHAAALANGGTSEGAPDTRDKHGPDYFIAYIRDPEGNKMAIVHAA